jgi:predicted permease
MSLFSRILNVFRSGKLNRDLDEELASHLEEAVASGRDPNEARRALGSPLRHREASRDAKLLVWLDSLRCDAVFGWRQLGKHKITSAAAILSLALAMGSCTAAFRLIDALLFRPLPISHPERLYAVVRYGLGPSGDFRISDATEYPCFRQMRAAVAGRAKLIAVSYAQRDDITYATDNEMEKAYRQYVSGWTFSDFGLQPALGRLFTDADDVTPGAHPVAVLSYDYWKRRFGLDPGVIGRTFHKDNDLFTIVGVAPKDFTGTEPGVSVDIFLPTMMHEGVTHVDWSWFRTLAIVSPGTTPDSVRDTLQRIVRGSLEERAKSWTAESPEFIKNVLDQKVLVLPAASGWSGMQDDYRSFLAVLAGLVALVLLIACANVANLMAAQAAARAREMALRVSIGAGRRRLIQLVLVESAWIALLAAALGAFFAWWAAPFVVGRINPPDDPASLRMPADWRVLGFAALLTFAITFLFGLAPALRASGVKPASALKGGENPHHRPRLMYALVAAQVAFCFVVTFAAGLFVATFKRLANQPTGFSSERLLILDATSHQPQPSAVWDQVAAHLRSVSGVESVGFSEWPLLEGDGWNGFIWVNGAATNVLADLLAVSPNWLDTMKIPLIDGRDLRPEDAYPNVAIVNEAFAQQCFGVTDPVGRYFEQDVVAGSRKRIQVVGLVANARYRNMREPIPATAYVPFNALDAKGAVDPKQSGSFIVRTSAANPLWMASLLRQEVPRARPELRVSNVRTQLEVNRAQTVRERLLAMLALFFAAVALLLTAVGLYGVLHYSVIQRRREIGVRIAIGAQPGAIARLITRSVVFMVAAGAAPGVAAGIAFAHFIESLLYQVKSTDATVLSVPAVTVLVTAALAALPPILQASRIDPASMLRAE